MTMRERMARAMHARRQKMMPGVFTEFDIHGQEHPIAREMLYGEVDAALDALLEPTTEMYDAALPYMDSYSSNGAWWQAMIRAARAGK